MRNGQGEEEIPTDKDQVKKLLGWTLANFPGMQAKELGPTAELWFRVLGDLPYEVAENALLKVLSTAKFFPTVAEIREAAAEIAIPGLPSPAEAWAQVSKAVRRFGSYREKDGLASLQEQVRQAAECIGWRELCLTEDVEIVRAQFMRVYGQYEHRKREEVQLPGPVRQLIHGMADGMDIPGIAGGADANSNVVRLPARREEAKR